MLVKSFGLSFFLKTPKNQNNIRYIYLRVTVDGLSRETSTKRTWDVLRWDSKVGRAIGTKEDARTLNYFLETIVTKINQYKTDLLYAEKTITAQRIIDYILGKTNLKALLLEEFLAHNEEIKSLINIDYAIATYKRYVIARSHVQKFIKCKYNIEDIDFRELNHEFIVDYENYLKTVRHCANNSTLKYIACLRKIINRDLDKNIISTDPFKLFKRKGTKIVKKPLTKQELSILENHKFSTQRLSIVRDIFVFQCYTGLAYIDVYQLQKSDVKIGLDGKNGLCHKGKKLAQ
nr:site-specific integrase [uncultured Flavobacterium sp.]